jgi:predicted transcriptional regulator of viral defense system
MTDRRHARPKLSPNDAYVALVRASSLALRPGIVILEQDLSTLTPMVGSTSSTHGLISTLERQGRLKRVRRGAYVLADAAGGVQIGLLDLIAALTPKPYLVTGGRALQFHELSDQHFRRVDVLTRAQLRSWSWRGDAVRYSRTSRALRAESARTRKTPARVAVPERAIADSLANPRWGVTLSQVVEALDILLRRDPGAPDRLAAETALYDSHALARRLGLLVSRIADAQAARPFLALRGSGKSATPLRVGGAASGPIDETWHVRENAEVAALAAHARGRR